jgi:hypothetical protein
VTNRKNTAHGSESQNRADHDTELKWRRFQYSSDPPALPYTGPLTSDDRDAGGNAAPPETSDSAYARTA